MSAIAKVDRKVRASFPTAVLDFILVFRTPRGQSQSAVTRAKPTEAKPMDIRTETHERSTVPAPMGKLREPNFSKSSRSAEYVI